MVRGFRIRSRRALVPLGLFALAALAAAASGFRLGPTPLAPQIAVCESSTMTDDQMAALSKAHYDIKPASAAIGYGPVAPQVVAVDTFIVRNYQFDADHHPNTQNDVVTVHVGESVMFKWESGFHTTTSGDPGDFDSGSLWDYPIDSTNPSVIVSFPNIGTFPFQCLYHGADFNMTGTVIVIPGTTPTKAESWGAVKAHFR